MNSHGAVPSSLGRLLPFHSNLGSSLHFPKKRRNFLELFLIFTRSNSWCCAVDVIASDESTSGSAPAVTQDSLFSCQQKFREMPKGFSSSNRPVSLRKIPEQDVRSKHSNLGAKERLRRYSKMLRDCTATGSLCQGKAIHGAVVRSGIKPDSHLWVSLIDFYSKRRSLVCARRVLDAMPGKDVVSCTALLVGFVGEGYGRHGLYLFYHMRKEGIRPNEFALAIVLKACSMCSDLDFGKQVHAEAIKLGFFLDLFVGSALVDVYAKCGEVELANRAFACMPKKNVVLWNALLNGYSQMGHGVEVLKLFCSMTEKEMRFTKVILCTVIKSCANSRHAREGRAIHSMAIKIGCDLDHVLNCALLDMYSKCGLPNEALELFKKIKDPDVVAWNGIITCFGHQGHSSGAADLFYKMRHTAVKPNEYILTSLVSAAADLKDLRYAESIHACICKYGFEFDNLVSNSLVTMYMQNGCISNGLKVFQAMTYQDPVSWNALLCGIHDHKAFQEVPGIFYRMLEKGLKPNMYTFNIVLRSCSNLLDVNLGKQVHGHVLKNSLVDDYFVGTALVNMYAKIGYLEEADVVFNRLINRDVVAWTTIITSCAQTDQPEKTLMYFTQMQREGVKPNEFTLASCLSSCSHLATLESGQLLHSMVIKSGHSCDMFVSSSLVDMYAKCGCIEDAEIIFQALLSRDTVLWNNIMFGYLRHGKRKRVLETFRMVLDRGVEPDAITFLGVLSACSHMGLVEEGKGYFNLMSKVYGIMPTVEHYACMVDVFGRAGGFNEVKRFIEEMKLSPNALIWETLLGASRLHGKVEIGEITATQLFELEPKKDSYYILLSNIFAAKGRWDDVRRVRALMTSQGVKKEPGCSWVIFNGQVHIFRSQDSFHPKIREIYIKLEELVQKVTSAGYIPKTENVLHNVNHGEKIEYLRSHSEKLALAFALLSRNHMKTIRIFKNMQICDDCHYFMKLVSDLAGVEVVLRDVNQFHHFKNGFCSCEDDW